VNPASKLSVPPDKREEEEGTASTTPSVRVQPSAVNLYLKTYVPLASIKIIL